MFDGRVRYYQHDQLELRLGVRHDHSLQRDRCRAFPGLSTGASERLFSDRARNVRHRELRSVRLQRRERTDGGGSRHSHRYDETASGVDLS